MAKSLKSAVALSNLDTKTKVSLGVIFILSLALLGFFGNVIARGLIVQVPINPPATLNYPVYLFTPDSTNPFVSLDNGGIYTLTQSQLKQSFALTVVPTLTIPFSNNAIIIDSYKWTLYKSLSTEKDITWSGSADTFKTFIPYDYNTFKFPGNIVPGAKRVNLTLKYHLLAGLSNVAAPNALTASMTFTIIIPCSINCKAGDLNCDGVFNDSNMVTDSSPSLLASGSYACADVNNNGVYWDATDVQATINAPSQNLGYWPYSGAFVNTDNGTFKYFPQITDPNSRTSIQASNLLTPTGFWMIGEVEYKNYAITNSDTSAPSLSLSLILKYEDEHEDSSQYQNINKDNVTIKDYSDYYKAIDPNSGRSINYSCIIYKNKPFLIETHVSNSRVIRNIYWLTIKQKEKPTTVWAEADWLGQNTGYVPRWNYILLNNYINAYPNILTGNDNCTVVATGP